MTHDEMIAVIQAHKEGKVIQAKSKRNLSSGWIYTNRMPEWNFEHLDYRVKPEPREFWLALNVAGKPVGTQLNRFDDLPSGMTQIKVTEDL